MKKFSPIRRLNVIGLITQRLKKHSKPKISQSQPNQHPTPGTSRMESLVKKEIWHVQQREFSQTLRPIATGKIIQRPKKLLLIRESRLLQLLHPFLGTTLLKIRVSKEALLAQLLQLLLRLSKLHQLKFLLQQRQNAIGNFILLTQKPWSLQEFHSVQPGLASLGMP